MADEQLVTGTSMESFADAFEDAFGTVEPQPGGDWVGADVVSMSLEKGGIVGRTQYHVALRPKHAPGD